MQANIPFITNEMLKKQVGAKKKVDLQRIEVLFFSFSYLTITRPNIMFITSLLSKYIKEPN